MVSSGQGEIGAGKLTSEILDIVAKVPEIVKQLTSVDISRVNVMPTINNVRILCMHGSGTTLTLPDKSYLNPSLHFLAVDEAGNSFCLIKMNKKMSYASIELHSPYH